MSSIFQNITKNMVYKAKFKEKICKVKWQNFDGTLLKEEEVPIYSSATPPSSNPFKNKCLFLGWDKDYNKITEDTIITAEYSDPIKLKVTWVWFDSVVREDEVEVDTAATAPDINTLPKKKEKVFSRWDRDFSCITENITVTAIFVDAQKFLVKWVDYNDSFISQQYVYYGDNATKINNPSREGYTFKGWNGDWNNITEDRTIKAEYDINVYTVTFCNEDGSVLKTEKVQYNKSATAPAEPTKVGYTFARWDKSFTNIKIDTTVTAVFRMLVYTVKWLYDTGTVYKTNTDQAGSKPTVPANPSKTGYTFKSWTPDPNTYTVNGDCEFKAIFEIKKYTVTYQNWDKTWIATMTNVEHGSNAPLPSVTPTKEHYTFSGWSPSNNNITSDTTCVAQFTIKKYTVTFKDGDRIIDVQQITYGSNATDPISKNISMLKTGWIFNGWDKEFTNISEDLIVNALYERNPYGISDDGFDAVEIVHFRLDDGYYILRSCYSYDFIYILARKENGTTFYTKIYKFKFDGTFIKSIDLDISKALVVSSNAANNFYLNFGLFCVVGDFIILSYQNKYYESNTGKVNSNYSVLYDFDLNKQENKMTIFIDNPYSYTVYKNDLYVLTVDKLTQYRILNKSLFRFSYISLSSIYSKMKSNGYSEPDVKLCCRSSSSVASKVKNFDVFSCCMSVLNYENEQCLLISTYNSFILLSSKYDIIKMYTLKDFNTKISYWNYDKETNKIYGCLTPYLSYNYHFKYAEYGERFFRIDLNFHLKIKNENRRYNYSNASDYNNTYFIGSQSHTWKNYYQEPLYNFANRTSCNSSNIYKIKDRYFCKYNFNTNTYDICDPLETCKNALDSSYYIGSSLEELHYYNGFLIPMCNTIYNVGGLNLTPPGKGLKEHFHIYHLYKK